MPTSSPSWLTDAVLYQIYPQSFADSDGDGIGDLAGITARLDHLAWLGVTAVWLSPCFASPFRDAGYDVSDYLTVAPRYGTNADLARLVEAAGRRGIRVLLDLVVGHTSVEHPWFLAAADDPTDGRYVWADTVPLPPGFVPSPGTRPGGFLPNFFDSQPALNFGYARPAAGEPWRQPVDADGPRANRDALLAILDHWLRLGIAGFRVDMASSLVKDDPGFTETAKLWTGVREVLDRDHPDAVLLSEWGDPAVAVPAGFHADFFLQFGGPGVGMPMRSLWNNRQGTDNPDWPPVPCYFDAAGGGSAALFAEAYEHAVATIGEPGHVALPTSNHDFSRLVCGTRTAEQVPAAFAFLLTWPTLPTIYNGDEIGMRYVPGLPDVEGSMLGPGYNRAGSRTPMQWDDGPGAGFSTAPPERLYLPVDPDPGRPTVAAQRADDASLLHLVRRLVRLRRDTPELGPYGTLDVLATGYPLVYVRGDRYLVAVNPSGAPVSAPLPRPEFATARPVEYADATVGADGLRLGPYGWGVFAR
ncbi:alpha-amylase family glycosyl hydrolase [Actinocatenispora rupis]|uniref:Alpha-amylase n=1 Tax=Actinocatenispora rupis TaxID=519421 RepID=A0A8J3NBX0_9ACTN|nr:alpha-amylase family glycosyl hydrolase [Actinocatenispora rupis]GID09779.1 alpha-amylase [Actinocatenispora rupis]